MSMYNELITYNLLLLNKCFKLRSQTPNKMTEKKCTKCGETLPIDNFRLSKSNKRAFYCLPCEKKIRDKFKSEHPGYWDKYYIPKLPSVKICAYCGSEFIPNHNSRQICCSKECSAGLKQNLIKKWKDAHRAPTLAKICERCGKEYNTNKKNQRYCCKPIPKPSKLSTLTPGELREHKLQYGKRWYAANKDKVKKWNTENKERIKSKRKEYIENNREAYYKKQWQYKKSRLERDPEYRAKRTQEKREYKNNRINNDCTYKLAVRLRNKVYLTLRKTHKYYHGLDLLGCSVDYARQHIENQFQPGMTWDNWDLHGWHIDHIRPIASFDLSIPSEQKKCFHYTNLQPLWCHDNWAKSDKIYDEQYAEIQ